MAAIADAGVAQILAKAIGNTATHHLPGAEQLDLQARAWCIRAEDPAAGTARLDPIERALDARVR
jgi:hypothetical protein